MSGSRTRAILTSTALFSALSLLPKILAVLKDVAVAARFGASESLDAFLMAFVLIGVPVSILVVALQTTLIPALVQRPDDRSAAALLGSTLRMVVAGLALVLPLWLWLLPPLLDGIRTGPAPAGADPILQACWWLIPYYFTNGINWVLYGALQARRSFWPNALLPALFPLATLVALTLSHEAQLQVLVIGTVAGSALECAVLLALLRRRGLLQWRDGDRSGLRDITRLAMPLMVGGLIGAFAPLVEQFIAYSLGPGAVSLISYGNKIPAALSSLLVIAMGVVALPHFSELVQQRNWRDCRHLYRRLTLLMLGGGTAIAAVFMLIALPLMDVLFVRGAFTAEHSLEASGIMRMYLLPLPFALAGILATKVLIASGQTTKATLIACLQFVLSGGLAYLLARSDGVTGVALGTAAGNMAGSALLVLVAWRWLGSRGRQSAP